MVARPHGKLFRSREIAARYTINQERHTASLVPSHSVDLLNEETTKFSNHFSFQNISLEGLLTMIYKQRSYPAERIS